LSKRAFATVQQSFTEEAERAFGFLASEFGLAGPEPQGVVTQGVAFSGGGVQYRILLDPDDKAVVTRVSVDGETATFVAELDSLVAAGLGSRERIPRSAHTLSSLRHALEAQARLVRLLLPLMETAGAMELMQKAHAREWHHGRK
jgi:hypothetical protein